MTTSNEAALLNAPDLVQLAFAIAQNRAMITQDADFLPIAATGEEQPGIVYFAAQSRSVGEVIRRVKLIWRCTSQRRCEIGSSSSESQFRYVAGDPTGQSVAEGDR